MISYTYIIKCSFEIILITASVDKQVVLFILNDGGGKNNFWNKFSWFYSK